MRRIVIVLLMLLSLKTFGQTNDSIKATKDTMSAGSSVKSTNVEKPVKLPKVKDTTRCHKMEIGFSFSPDYCYRKLKADAGSEYIADVRDTLEIPKFGYTAGVNLYYPINKRIVIESGVLFSDKGEKTKRVSFVNVPSGQLPMYYTYKYHYYYLDIPLKVNYYVSSSKLQLYVTAGVSANVFLAQQTTIIQGHDKKDGEKTTSTFNPEFNAVNFAMIAGIGINYKTGNKTTLKMEPVYRRSLNSIINAPIKEYLYSLGVNVGISYAF